jgi:ArsR family transcriptional regulator
MKRITKARPGTRADRARESFPAPEVELARLAKALGHPARIAILRLLAKRGDCVCGGIVDQLPLAQATVSQHLRILKDTGFVTGEVEGPRVCYCLEPETMRRFRRLIEQL